MITYGPWWLFRTMTAGAAVRNAMAVGNGVWLGAVAGGDPGADQMNCTKYHARGNAGLANFSGAVANITVRGGIVTAAS